MPDADAQLCAEHILKYILKDVNEWRGLLLPLCMEFFFVFASSIQIVQELTLNCSCNAAQALIRTHFCTYFVETLCAFAVALPC
jgi:hypothetical protein